MSSLHTIHDIYNHMGLFNSDQWTNIQYLCICPPKLFKQDKLRGQHKRQKKIKIKSNTALITHTLHSDDMNTSLLRCAGRIRK